jgi:hypothetical protein
MELLKVKTVYGKIAYISKSDYDGSRVGLRLYKKDGMRLVYKDDSKPTSLHRDNIAEVLC